MKDFCLGFVVSGVIGLIVGYLWGAIDGYRAGLRKEPTGDEKPPRSPFDGPDDITPA